MGVGEALVLLTEGRRLSASQRPTTMRAARHLANRGRAGTIRCHAQRFMQMMDLGLVQWPAMVVTLIASWLVASKDEHRRNVGFWVFMMSNALWVVWGLHSGATALIALQLCLAAMNIRGAMKTE